MQQLWTWQLQYLHAPPPHTPVGDFQSSRWCEFVTGGWLGCDSHSAEFFAVVSGGRASPPVSGPAGVPGSQGPVALVQVDGVQISIQLERDRARPALPGHGLTGLYLCKIEKRFIWLTEDSLSTFDQSRCILQTSYIPNLFLWNDLGLKWFLNSTTWWQHCHMPLKSWKPGCFKVRL